MSDKEIQMVEKISWEEFIDTGLLLYINQVLQVFGLSIAYEYDENPMNLTDVYPVKSKYRGFDEENVHKSYYNITHYIKNHIDELEEATK